VAIAHPTGVMIRVADLCKRRVVTVAPGDAIQSAIATMRREHVGDVVVVTQGAAGPTPVGILTDRDVIIELLAENIDLDRITVGDCMSEAIITARNDEELLVALQRMAGTGVRRLPIVDASGLLTGILSVDDVIAFIGEATSAVAEIIAEGHSRESSHRS
jgi:CBS domain-containing protein